MPYSNINELPEQAQVLPDAAKRVWLTAFMQALDKGNSEVTCMKYAWGAVNKRWQKSGKMWVKKKDEECNDNLCIFKESSPIIYREGSYSPGDIMEFQFCCVGDNVSTQTLDSFIENFKSNAYGQPIGWHVNHPFFRGKDEKQTADNRRYGDIVEVYRKGDEGWFKVRVNSLGAEILNDRQYISNSPGWFTSYKHQLTDEKVTDVLFEISATNIPAEKMMNLIIEMAEKMPMEPMGILKPKQTPNNMPEEDEPEPFESLYERMKKDWGECLNRFKNKTGNASRRMKIRDLLSDIGSKMKSEETEAFEDQGLFKFKEQEESIMNEESAKVKLAEEQIKILQEQAATAKAEADEAKAKAKIAEEQLAKVAEAQFESDIKTLAESYLPKEENGVAKFKLKKAELDKFYPVARKFRGEEDMTTLKNFLDSLPEVEVKLSAQGVSGMTPDAVAKAEETKTKMTDEQIEMKAMENARLNEKWADKTMRLEIYENERAKILQEVK